MVCDSYTLIVYLSHVVWLQFNSSMNMSGQIIADLNQAYLAYFWYQPESEQRRAPIASVMDDILLPFKSTGKGVVDQVMELLDNRGTGFVEFHVFVEVLLQRTHKMSGPAFELIAKALLNPLKVTFIPQSHHITFLSDNNALSGQTGSRD